MAAILSQKRRTVANGAEYQLDKANYFSQLKLSQREIKTPPPKQSKVKSANQPKKQKKGKPISKKRSPTIMLRLPKKSPPKRSPYELRRKRYADAEYSGSFLASKKTKVVEESAEESDDLDV